MAKHNEDDDVVLSKLAKKNVTNLGKTVADLIKRGITGADIARNPNINIGFANLLQAGADEKAANIAAGNPNLEIDATDDLKEFSFLDDFISGVSAIKQDFITGEIERQFGPQNITSTTAAGGVGRKPTADEIAAIGASFQSPLARLVAGKPPLPGLVERPGQRPGKTPPPTIISGQRQQPGRQRRRARGEALAPTILTSDSGPGGEIGGPTILG